MEPTQSYLKELFDYHPDGHLIWKKNRFGVTIGTKAGALHVDKKTGYKRIRITLDGESYTLSRIIYVWHYGNFQDKDIDHIDGDSTNNKISNLRLASRSENSINRSLRVDNKSGCKGVSFDKEFKKWRVSITRDKKRINLGKYFDLSFAIKIRQEAEEKIHGEWARK